MSCKGDCCCEKDGCKCGHGECDCGNHGGFERRFATKEEMIEEFEYYLADLKKEVQAVEERIADLKN